MNCRFFFNVRLSICALACWVIPINAWGSWEINGIYYELIDDNTAEVCSNPNYYSGEITIPASIYLTDLGTFNVTSIGHDAFNNCTGLTEVHLPKSLKTIRYSAFERCTGLTSVYFNEGLTEIGDAAFRYCSNLTTLYIPNSVNRIGDLAFFGTPWYNNQPDGIVYAGNVAYSYKGNMPHGTAVQIKEGTVGIGSYAFWNCSGMTSLTIPNSLTTIGFSAFSGCSGLKSVTLPNSIISIEGLAFFECTSLTSLTIPSSVSSIGENAFGKCWDLTSITVDNGNPYYDSRDNCNAIIQTENDVLIIGCKNTVIPSSVTGIGEYAFSQCNYLSSITIPNGVEVIESQAFCGCEGLTSVEIPNSVSVIGSRSFQGCTSLTSLKIKSKIPAFIYSEAFDEVDKNSCTLYVPANCKSLYQSATVWGEFENIEEYNDTDDLDIISSGYCGNSITYTIYNDWSMVISGTGEMNNFDFNYEEDCPVNRDLNWVRVKNVTIEEGISSIGEYAFYGCQNLTSVTIPGSVASIGLRAFADCPILTYFNINDLSAWCQINFGDPIELAHSLYLNWDKIYNLVIPNGVTTIGCYAFSELTDLTSVTIPGSVANIGYRAFAGCTGLTSITMENEMPVPIDYETFDYVDKDACTLYVPTGSTSAFANAEGWSDFHNIEEYTPGPEVLSTGFCGDNLTYTIYSDMTMVISGTGAMWSYSYSSHISEDYYQSIKQVIIEEGVTSISYEAFYRWAGMTTLSISNSVTTIDKFAFSGCTSLSSVDIPNSVTNIGSNAFSGCTSLTSVSISSSVTSIGYAVFNGCSSLTFVSIPNGVTSIGEYAFQDCTGLTSVEFPNSLTSISSSAFSNCTGMISVDFPNSVMSIDNGAFSGCTGLTSVIIPSSVTSIGAAFSGCTNLNSIVVSADNSTYDSRDNCNAIIETSTNTLIGGCKNTIIPNSVTSIGGSAFNGCSSLTTLTIPNSVTSIGGHAFEDCTGLTSVTIPNSVTSIVSYAFCNCTSLSSIIIPSSMTSIGYGAFQGCRGLTSVTVEWITPFAIGDDTFYNVNKTNCTLYVPAGSKSAYESASGWNIFRNIVEYTPGPEVLATGSCGDNVTYTIYEDMKMVISGTGAMDYYLGDTHINNDYYQLVQNLIIEEGVTSIGSSAFSGCIGLTSVTIPSSVTNIGWYAFSGCTSLTSVEIPNSVTTIGNYAFSGCSSLSSVTIPNSVTFIGSDAFEGTAWFNNKPDGLVYAGRHAYKYKGEMPQGTGIVIEDGTLTIVGMAFSGCTGLTSVEIPSSVTSVGENAFEGCEGLTSVTIPNSVTTIRPCAFQGCTGLTSIEIPNSVSEICDYAFSGCTSLTSLTIPNSVTLIGEEAFSGCTGLTSMSFPNSVTRICFCAFSGCTGLTSLTIPESVTEIGLGGFMGCTGLTSIVANGEIPAHLGMNSNGQYVMYEDVFRNVDKTNCTLYVPIGCESVYENANGWSEFQNIVERGILATGSCGDNVTYTIYSDMSMIISGSGAMTNFNVEIGGEETLNRENEEYWSAVKKVTIEEGVTSIGDYAFCDCEYLTSLTIPNSVTSIGNMALYGCRSLSSITIPAGVSIIGADAFSAGLKRIILEDSYEELLFSPSTLIMQDDDPLEYVYLGRDIRTKDFGEENSWEGVESFPPFAYHYNLHTLEIGDMVTYLEDESFSGDPLRSLVIGRNVQSIGIRALDSANEGEIMVVPNNVKRVGDCCLSPSISALVLEKGDDDLEIYSGYYSMELSFCGSESLIDSIYVGRNLVCTSDIIFNKCRSACIDATLIRKINDEEEEYEGYDDSEYYNPPICATNLYIEEGASIGSYYFQNSPVVHVYIKNPSELGDFAFFNSSLESIDFDINGPASIGNSVFSGCNKLTTLTIPEGVTEIGDYAFMDCYGLSSITIPSSLKSIGGYSFYRMDTENGVSRNVYISDLSAWCSMDIGWLGSPLLWGHLIHNGQEITNLVVPNDVQSIGIGAFEGSSLTSVIIPFGVVLIGDRAFNFCSDLATVTFPNSLTRIGEEAFRYCIVLTSVEIPNSVIEIGRSAFSFSGLTSLIIPNSVSAIESEAFSGCNGLTSVSVDWTVPLAIDNFTFNEVDKTNCTLYVPAGSKTAYENAEGWNEFENIVEIGEEPDTDISALDNAIYVTQTAGRVGGTMNISVRMKTGFVARAFQFTMQVPEGVKINGWKLSDKRLSPDVATTLYHDISDDFTSIFVGCSLNSKDDSFMDRDGEIATINVTIDESMAPGSYPIYLTTCTSTHLDENMVIDEDLDDVKSTLVVEDYMLGDANGDGKLRIGDATSILIYISGTQLSNFNAKAADANEDGKLRIGDVTAVLYMLADQE